MSNFGLYSGWYAQLREYSELVDHVLLLSISQTEPRAEAPRRRLSKLFRSLSGTPDADPRTTLLRIWMGRHIRLSPSQWQSLAEAVLQSSTDEAVVQRLEQVARQLDLHRAQVLSEMRGR